MQKNRFSLIFIIPLIILGAFLFMSYFSQVRADDSDAIGVRIIPNPNHYSIYRWYESQGFEGSPQALIVDGYEAVRDGRTVYVNAANVDQNTKLIYTNIYLISYNQDSTAKTVDILGQIVSHWKFNSNIIENTNPGPTCSITSLNCDSDQDCGKNQYCATSSSAIGTCVLNNQSNCLTDEDCPSNFFCNSLKAKIIRDLKRIGKVEELKEALFKFKTVNNYYPKLSSGSYLMGHTISVWPSWSQGFLADLTLVKNFFDPINRLGYCPGYDSETCWNKDTQTFVYNPTAGYLMLPADSYALVYSVDSAGSDYNLCAVMETRSSDLNYHFSPNDPIGSACVTATGIISSGQATNTAPVLIDKSLTGEAGLEFNGFVKVIDAEGNPLTWVLNTGGINWTGWENNSSVGQPPILQDTNNISQKKIYAQKAGNPGEYNTILTVSDGQGAVLSTNTLLTIINPAPFIEAQNGEFVLDPTIPFIYNFTFSDNNISNPANAYSVTKISGPFDLLNNSGLNKTSTSVGINRYKINYQGLIPTSHKFTEDTDFVYQVQATDQYGASSSKQFTIKIIAENPQLNFSCSTLARVNQSYSCFLGSTKQGNHSLTYDGGNLPSGLSIQTSNQGQPGTNTPPTANLQDGNSWFGRFFEKIISSVYRVKEAWGAVSNTGNVNVNFSNPVGGLNVSVYLKGKPTTISSGDNISIKATNEYGTFSTRDFILKVNNYCGDGQTQAPNTENRGGIYNDGFEDCDGGSNITSIPAQSSILKQYGCTTALGETTPNPIPNNNYCVFKSPLSGGGFCGDAYCQAILIGNNGATSTLETTTNCPEDCGIASGNCTPNCVNKECGDDGCGDSCGACTATGQACVSNNCQAICTPNCFNKECGDDGCGGSCGTCPGNQQCINGECSGPSCGNGNCQTSSGENCLTCPADCGCLLNQTCINSGICCTITATSCDCGIMRSYYTKCGNDCCSSSQACCNGACTNNSSGQYIQCGSNCCLAATQKCCPGNICQLKSQKCTATPR